MTAQLEQLTKDAKDKGQLIEAGWLSLRRAAVPPNASPIQLDEMRSAFFAGARHLFSSMVAMLDPDSEPSDADLRRMDQIQKELDAFISAYAAGHKPKPMDDEQAQALAALRNLHRSYKRRNGGQFADRPFTARSVPGWIYDPKTDQVAPSIGDAPIEEHLTGIMNAMAQGTDELLNPNGVQVYGFALLVFRFGEGGRFNYISNASRADMIVAFKEQLARLEGQPEVVGQA